MVMKKIIKIILILCMLGIVTCWVLAALAIGWAWAIGFPSAIIAIIVWIYWQIKGHEV